MSSSSNLKKVLLHLRDNNIISEKEYLKALEKLKDPSKVIPNQSIPLLDMFGLQRLDLELQHLDSSLEKIEKNMEEIARAWEKGSLSREKTKINITNLVRRKNGIIDLQKNFQIRIRAKISRLNKLNQHSRFDIENFASSFIDDEESVLTEMSSEFLRIWEKYSRGFLAESESDPVHQKLDDIETKILNSLMVPLKDGDRVVFDLDEVIKPIDEDKIPQPPLLEYKSSEENNSLNDIHSATENSIQSVESKSPWDFVGKVLYNANKSPIGIVRPPIIIKGETYLPLVMEEPLSIATLKEKYKDVLKQAELDLDVTTTQKIRNTIAKAMDVPEKIVLQPSIFNSWISDLGFETLPTKPQLKKVHFLKASIINNKKLDDFYIEESDLIKLRLPVWIPARGETVVSAPVLGKKVIGMAGSSFGTIIGIMEDTPFGQSVIVKRDVPPSSLLTLYLEGLGLQNFAELRFTIAKKLKIGEGEVFSAKNLWTLNNQERLLISPHEIAVSYYAVLPTSAFIFHDIIKAKIGVYFHSIPEVFHHLIGKTFPKSADEKGIVYGFIVEQGRFYILWSSKDPIDMIKEVGRKSSEQYVNRFRRRMSLALGISYQDSLWPSNMARYFLNFIWMTESQSLMEAMSAIENRFSLNRVSFSEISEIKEGELKYKTQIG